MLNERACTTRELRLPGQGLTTDSERMHGVSHRSATQADELGARSYTLDNLNAIKARGLWLRPCLCADAGVDGLLT
jgi:hypothetical protein